MRSAVQIWKNMQRGERAMHSKVHHEKEEMPFGLCVELVQVSL
jgi:hypothetical protein